MSKLNRNPAPLCACGCLKHVKWNKYSKKWNVYINHHQSRSRNGINNPNYKPEGKTAREREWKIAVLIRDHYTCQECFGNKEHKILCVGRIKSQEDFPELIFDINNGITLCRSCHSSIHHLGKPQSIESKKKKSISHQGKKDSEITRRKKSKSAEGHPGHIFTQEEIEKMRSSQIGRRSSKETNEKHSKTMKEKWQDPEYRKKQPNCSWMLGLSKSPYSQDWTEDLKDSIRKRDNYECQLCCINQNEIGEKITVHHIDYSKENCDPENLISLCRSCHMKTNHDRNKWIIFLRIVKLQNAIRRIIKCLNF